MGEPSVSARNGKKQRPIDPIISLHDTSPRLKPRYSSMPVMFGLVKALDL